MRKGSRSPACKSHRIDLESYRSMRRAGYGPCRQGSVGWEMILICLCKLRIYQSSAALDVHLSLRRMNQTGKSFAGPPFSSILLTISSATRKCECKNGNYRHGSDLRVYKFLITTYRLWRERVGVGRWGGRVDRTSALLSYISVVVGLFPLLPTSARRLIHSPPSAFGKRGFF